MATSSALYRTPPPSSTPDRGQVLTVPEFAKFAALKSDLEELIAAGFLEAFEDEQNVQRFRPLRSEM
ncbi:MAG TPA: hypothetical protein VFF58_00460 [Candidatus Nitrosotalea sp.]|nr:hypothetical protein [Candidatus Nitrosotalea sp.]